MRLYDRIRLKPTAAEVSRLNTWFDQRCAASGIERDLCADLKLCMNEAVVNLMSYAFKTTRNPLTIVEIDLKPGSATAVITDNGLHFDIRGWQPVKDRDFMNGDPGGFGIALMKERATHLFYTRIGERNQLRIVCRSPSP